MLFGLIPTKRQPAPDPQAPAPPISEARGGPLGRACAAALSAIQAAAAPRAVAERAERFSELRPLTPPAPAAAVGERRVDVLMASATGADSRQAQVRPEPPRQAQIRGPADWERRAVVTGAGVDQRQAEVRGPAFPKPLG
jgi:hypothetical protein